MQNITTILILSILTLLSEKAQSQTPELMFVIDTNGDSLVTSKIFNSGTNEDKVTFVFEGSRKQLLSAEVKSYFKNGRKVSIKLSKSNASKLVTVLLRGDIILAKSKSLNGKEMYYINYKEDWIKLDHTSTNLRDQISELIPDFQITNDSKKIHYNIVSLGDAISKYNEYKDPNSIRVGKFKFNGRNKIGVYGVLGMGKININNSSTEFNTTVSTGIGLSAKLQYSRLVTLLVQSSYSNENWKNENWDIKLKTLNLTPLISIQLYNKSNYFKLSGAFGLNANIDLASKFTSLKSNNIRSFGLSGVGLGYDFQLHSSFGENFDMFASYLIMPKRNSENYGIAISNNILTFRTTTIKFGIIYYL